MLHPVSAINVEADSFANGPTSLSRCRPSGPTTWLGDGVGEMGPRGAGQEPVSWDGVTHSYDRSAELFVNTP